MAQKNLLTRQTFLEVAKASGLRTKGPHMEELYTYLKKILPGIKSLEELDLNNMEPSTPFISIKEALE
jgi:Asp-tRNA(Asn)/Glu-tRNA(Gln) amidotransferase C subunit